MKISRSAQTDDVRENMRGGKGSVTVRKLAPAEALPTGCRLIAEITLNPGCSIGNHEHRDETEIFHITSGRGLADDDGRPAEVGPGDVIVTGNASHSIENTGTEPLVMTAVIILH